MRLSFIILTYYVFQSDVRLIRDLFSLIFVVIRYF